MLDFLKQLLPGYKTLGTAGLMIGYAVSGLMLHNLHGGEGYVDPNTAIQYILMAVGLVSVRVGFHPSKK